MWFDLLDQDEGLREQIFLPISKTVHKRHPPFLLSSRFLIFIDNFVHTEKRKFQSLKKIIWETGISSFALELHFRKPSTEHKGIFNKNSLSLNAPSQKRPEVPRHSYQFLGRATRFMFLWTQMPWARLSTPLNGSAICQSNLRNNYSR